MNSETKSFNHFNHGRNNLEDRNRKKLFKTKKRSFDNCKLNQFPKFHIYNHNQTSTGQS